MVESMRAFCQRVRTSLAHATFEQQRTLVEILIDRVLVANGDVEIRYAIPSHPRGEMTRFCQLCKTLLSPIEIRVCTQTQYACVAPYGHYVDNNPTLTNDCNSLLYSAVLPSIASVLTD